MIPRQVSDPPPGLLDFIDSRLDPDARRILTVEVGSTAHGTALPGGDDFDCAVIYLPTAKEILGLTNRKGRAMYRTKPEGQRSEPGDFDVNAYSLKAWMNLALKGNPSILQMLWCPEISATREGVGLQNLAPEFVGRHIIPSYRGYMKSQVERIVGTSGGGHGQRGSGGRRDLIEAHGYDTKFAMHAARLGFQCIELMQTQHLELPMTGSAGDWLRAVRRGEVPFGDWFEKVLHLDDVTGRMLSWEDIPEGPNLAAIEGWFFNTMLRRVTGTI